MNHFEVSRERKKPSTRDIKMQLVECTLLIWMWRSLEFPDTAEWQLSIENRVSIEPQAKTHYSLCCRL